jgi:hypothetical protein
MMTRFKQLFSLEVWHDYYGGVYPDAGFVISDKVAATLRGAGMFAKVVGGTLYVVFRADDTGAPVQRAAGKTLRFGLVIRDPYFANITEGFDPSKALHYRNSQVATALDDPPDKVALRDVDPALWRDGALGLVDIAIDPVLYTRAASFQIRFAARVDTWRYYVVVKGFSNGDVDQLAVQPQTSGAPAPGDVAFDKVPPAQLTADEKARTDVLATDGAKVLLFRSATGIPRRETGAKPMQLLRNTEAVIERLPQPGKSRGTADLIVQLSKSKP